MAQIGAARDQSQPCLCGQWLETPQRRSKALVLRIPRAFADIKPVDEQSVADIGGIISSIETLVAHQHVEAVDASGDKSDGPPGSPVSCLRYPTAGSFDRGHRDGIPPQLVHQA